MKQLGNLSIVCAKRPDVLMQVYGGRVSVHVGEGPERARMDAAWDDDKPRIEFWPLCRSQPWESGLMGGTRP